MLLKKRWAACSNIRLKALHNTIPTSHFKNTHNHVHLTNMSLDFDHILSEIHLKRGTKGYKNRNESRTTPDFTTLNFTFELKLKAATREI